MKNLCNEKTGRLLLGFAILFWPSALIFWNIVVLGYGVGSDRLIYVGGIVMGNMIGVLITSVVDFYS